MNAGIFGGTFDPPHNGHLAVAKAAIKQLKLDVLYIVPCGIPVLKDERVVSPAGSRLRMCKIQFSSVKKCRVSDYEIRSKRKSYTLKTLLHLMSGSAKNTKFFLVTGSDAVSRPEKWHRFEAITSLCTIAVAQRPGFKDSGSRFAVIKGEFPNLSSSKIRSQVRKGKKPSGISKKIYDYVKRNRMFI